MERAGLGRSARGRAVAGSGGAALDQFAAEQDVHRLADPPGDLVVEDLQGLERGRPDGASKDTVNAALSFVAQRRRRIEHLLDDPQAFGLGPDIGNPEIMRQARR